MATPFDSECRSCKQCGRWERRAVSLERDYIGVVALKELQRCSRSEGSRGARSRRNVMGLYRETSSVASCRSGGFQSWHRGKPAPTGREKRTPFVRGRLRRNTHRSRLKSASCNCSKSKKSGKSQQVAGGGADGGEGEGRNRRLRRRGGVHPPAQDTAARKHEGCVGAARDLGIDRQTVAACMDRPTLATVSSSA